MRKVRQWGREGSGAAAPPGHHPPSTPHQHWARPARVLPASVTLHQAEQPQLQQVQRWRLSHLLIQTVHVDSAFLPMNMVKWSSHQQEVRGPVHVDVHRAQLRAKIGPYLKPRRNSAYRGAVLGRRLGNTSARLEPCSCSSWTTRFGLFRISSVTGAAPNTG